MWGVPPISYNFFEKPLSKLMPPFYLKMKPPLTEKQPQLKSEALFQEMIPWKKKNRKIPQERDFLTWRIQNFVRKVTQFV